MSFQDQTLTCADCGKNFIFTAGEQEFHHQKGFSNTPKRCGDCRAERKAMRGGKRDFAKRENPKFPAVCSRCGASFDAPFQPKPDRMILCRGCFGAAQNK